MGIIMFMLMIYKILSMWCYHVLNNHFIQSFVSNYIRCPCIYTVTLVCFILPPPLQVTDWVHTL